MEATFRCPRCRADLAAMWTFCPTCGASVERPSRETAAADADGRVLAALQLLAQGRSREAEASLASAISPEALLLHARLLTERQDFQSARERLDEALALAPRSFLVRVRRCEFFARVGLYPDALTEARAARHVAADVASLMHAQDLERRLEELTKHSFVREPSLPRPPAWLRGVAQRLKKSPVSPV
jgi:Tfp pilus assembly protein PilF